MAEAIFKYLLEQQGMAGQFQADSAAVAEEESGSPVNLSANMELEKHGLPRSEHIARCLTQEDYERFDYILGMDMDNYYRMKYRFKGDPKKKVGLLMGYTDRPERSKTLGLPEGFRMHMKRSRRGARRFWQS